MKRSVAIRRRARACRALGGAFEQAQRRGADRDDAPAPSPPRSAARRSPRARSPSRHACDARRYRRCVTGRKVPGPTCSVTKCAVDPARFQRLDQLRREMQAGGRRGHRPFLAREDRLIVDAVLLVRCAGARRCRAAAACAPSRAIASSRLASLKSKASVTSPSVPLLLDRRVERAEQADAPSPSPKQMRSPAFEPLRRASPAPSSGSRSSLPVSVTEMCADVPSRDRALPLSSAGITLVSLNTSTSPG